MKHHQALPAARILCHGLVAFVAAFGAGCGGKLAADSFTSTDGGGAETLPAGCNPTDTLPSRLECTGLYSDLAQKAVWPSARSYVPSSPLWSDGAGKARWLRLPPGTTIDRTNPNEWVFPVGTKVWKEFSRNGHRIETRLFAKLGAGYWTRGTYAWNADETAALLSGGGDVPLPAPAGQAATAETYHIPTNDECDKCHNGRVDHVLGFEEASLGLPGAQGVTLAMLASENLLSPKPSATALTLGDDGTGLAAPALAWIHVNCGVSCHNGSPTSTGYGANLILRLDATQLDGRSSADFPPLTTTIGVLATSGAVIGKPRILAGDPDGSLLVQLISERGTLQMPPIASKLVDQPDVDAIRAWIAKLPVTDAGVGDAAAADAAPSDAGLDASNVDATITDAGAGDASPPEDAGVDDAGDAGTE